MAVEDSVQPRPQAERSSPAAKPTPPPLQPRSRTPKALEGPSSKQQQLGQHPVRPTPLRTMSNASIAYSQTMFGGGVAPDREGALQPPRPAKHELDKEELTTKGRKRKRLAKACSACHKNKRRCDGFAPCSNCEFSARPCIYLNAQGEQIPPPRTRDSSVQPMAKRNSDDGGRPNFAGNGSERSNGNGKTGTPGAPGSDEWARRDYRPGVDVGDWRAADARGFGPLDLVDRDISLSAELIDIFFKRTPPYAAMTHVPTFLNRYYMNRVSPILLDAIYTISARLCTNPAFVATFSTSVPNHLRGQVFAERCRANLDRIIDLRQRWTEEERNMDSGTWEETEFVQSALLLSVYFNSIRQPRLGLFYIDTALSVLRPNSLGALPPPAARLNLSSHEYYTLAEIRNRSFWLCVIGDICSAASGRQRRVRDHEISTIPLPGPEMYWTRYGGMGIGNRDPMRRDNLTVGTGNWHSEEGQVGELGHIIRILALFSNIMAIANNGGPGSQEARHLPVSHYEQALKSWALDLPRHLRFDEINLSHSVQKIQSTIPEVSLSGWAFGYMHAVAECGMFYLQSRHLGAPFAVQRQGQAVDNLTVVIDSLGERGREGPLMFFPIMIITCWMDHVRASSPSSSQVVLEERLNQWWAQVYNEWGWERHETIERGIFPCLEADRAPHERPLPIPTPTNARQMFEQAQQQQQQLQQPVPLPAQNLHVPSPVPFPQQKSSPHPTPSESTASGSSANPITPSEANYPPNVRYPLLPPLRPRDGAFPRSPSPSRSHRRVGSIGSVASSVPAEREREHGGPLPPISAYRSSPLDREWERERERERDAAPGDKERSREGTPRPLQPPRRERWPTSMSGGPLLGIDALVSAAEEQHRRESMEEASAIAA